VSCPSRTFFFPPLSFLFFPFSPPPHRYPVRPVPHPPARILSTPCRHPRATPLFPPSLLLITRGHFAFRFPPFLSHGPGTFLLKPLRFFLSAVTFFPVSLLRFLGARITPHSTVPPALGRFETTFLGGPFSHPFFFSPVGCPVLLHGD